MFALMEDWKSIIVALGGTGAVAEALNQSDSTVSGWQSPDRRGVPAAHWAALVALASDRGIPGITLEVFADLAAREVVEARA